VWGSHWVVSPNSAAHSIRLKTRYNAPISTRLGGGKAMQEIIMSQQEFGTQIIQHIEEMLARAEHDIHTGGQREEPYNKGYLAAFRDIIASVKAEVEKMPDAGAGA
jgi:hypothetical protein